MKDSIELIMLSSLISLLGIWILYFWLYLDYRVDSFRDELFALRDKLFDIAKNGEIDFNNPAYGMLRSYINSTIKYGHRFSFMQLIASTYFTRNDDVKKEYIKMYNEKWYKSLDKLDQETKRKLLIIRNEVQINIVIQLILTSPVLFFTLISFIAVLLLKKVSENTIMIVKKFVGDQFVRDMNNNITFATLVSGGDE